MNLQQIRRAVLYAALVALGIAGAGFFSTRPVAGREAKPASLQGAAAIERLKQDGQYESLNAAIKRVRPGIELESGGAASWLTPDPLFSFQQKLLASDGETYDRFGTAVALYKDTVVIGAVWDAVPNPYQGSVYVFVRNGTTWTEQQKLTASDGEGTDNFGSAVAIYDDTIVVGTQVDDVGPNVNQGSVYVFVRNGTVWMEKQKLTASDGAAYDNFGNSVAIAGDTLVIGAFEDDMGTNWDQGSVYVFKRTNSNWTEQQKLIGSLSTKYDGFGKQVAIDGNTLVVGTPYDDQGAFNQGAIYVFARVGSTWIQQQFLTSGAGVFNQFYGSAVAVKGDTIAVGAYGDNIGANTSQGSVYVYKRSGTDWMFQQKLIANDGAAYDNFGYSVALNGETLVVGAYTDDINANTNQGSAYVFKGSGPTWTQEQKLIAGDGDAQDFFGDAVVVGDDTIMVGVKSDNIGANDDQGSVYVFIRPSCPALTITPASLPNGFSGPAYQQPLAVSGGTGSYQFALIAGSLPAGISMSSTGVLSGTTTTTGTYQFWVSATDLSSGCSVSHQYSLTIESCLTIVTASLPNGMSGLSYQQSVTATGGTGPYQFTLDGGALPAGLSLAANGVLSGTPSTPGTYGFSIRATDLSSLCTTSRAYSMTIEPPCSPLTIDPPTLPSGLRGAPYSETLTVTGGVYPYTFNKKGVLPPGLNLSVDGVISGTPTQTGNFSFTVVTSDALGCFGSRTYTLTIRRPFI